MMSFDWDIEKLHRPTFIVGHPLSYLFYYRTHEKWSKRTAIYTTDEEKEE